MWKCSVFRGQCDLSFKCNSKEQKYTFEICIFRAFSVFFCWAMVQDNDFFKDMWVAPDIWVPPSVADFLISRMQWIRQGEHADFQVGAPAGFDFDDLATLAHLIVNNDLGHAKLLADNLPRSITWMEPSSSSLLEGNKNYTKKNPFKRRRKQRRGKKNGAGGKSVQV